MRASTHACECSSPRRQRIPCSWGHRWCKLPNVKAKNQTQVLCKSSVFLSHFSRLSRNLELTDLTRLASQWGPVICLYWGSKIRSLCLSNKHSTLSLFPTQSFSFWQSKTMRFGTDCSEFRSVRFVSTWLRWCLSASTLLSVSLGW